MNKDRILKIASSHYNLFRFCTRVYNRLSFRNRLSAKGSKLDLGLSVIKGLKIKSYGTNNVVIIGDYTRINNCRFTIKGSNNKIIIKNSAALNQVELYMENSGNLISIGEDTNLCGKAHFAAIEGTEIKIGDRCLLSGELHFRTGDSHSLLDSEGKRINPSDDIVIEDHVWIGTKVTCLKGVHVSENSVVAATTTLCKKYNEKNVVIGGVPGRIIRTNVNWTKERL